MSFVATPRGAGTLDWRAARKMRIQPSTLLETMGIVTAPVYPGALAEQLGILVKQVHNPGWSGAATCEKGQPTIWVNADEADVRRRFTVSHELAHLLYHPLGVQYRDTDRQYGDRRGIEAQANRFAADLLMPPWMVERYIRSGAHVEDLAALFLVSNEAMSIQLGWGGRR